MDGALLDQAIRYTHLWGLSVFPIRRHGKRPIAEWSEYQRRLATVEELRDWPAGNLAIATGALSGLVVVDCESHEDAKWFWRQRAETSTVVATPRGFHLWFRHPGTPVMNAQKVPDESGTPRYDVRGDGGYVLAPPSEVVANGDDVQVSGRYEFTASRPLKHPRLLPIFNPSWRPSTTASGAGTRNVSDARRSISDGVAYISKIRAVSGQGGHNDTYRAVCKLRESGLDKSQALAAISEWNETNASPNWSARELWHKVESVYG